MEQELLEKISAQNEKIDAIWISVEKTRKYFLWTLWATVIMFLLPLVGLVFVIPMFLHSYIGAINGNTVTQEPSSSQNELHNLQSLLQ